MKNKGLAFASVFIIIGAIFRLLPHPPNVTPLAAMAFAGGVYLNKKYLAFLVPFAALFFSDFIINNTVARTFFPDHSGLVLFSDYMIWTYIAFGLTVILGLLLHNGSSFKKIVGGTLISSIAFFALTNFGAWLSSGLYPKNIAGLMLAFEAGVPFFRHTLISNAVFISVLVLSIETILKYSYKKQLA